MPAAVGGRAGAVHRRARAGRRPAVVTVSTGVASVRPAVTAEPRRLLIDADAALHRAKTTRRDRVSA
ncbi:diguanylate cyclase [Modestobacter sp. I12A-02628]|nr:diguanylate cyclase [Goekera deserti]